MPIPFPVEEFGPLNLVSDPTEIGTSGAVDLLNVDFDRPGQLRARDGVATLGTPGSSLVAGLGSYSTTAGLRQLIIGFGLGTTKIEAYDTAGTLVTSQAVASIFAFSTARWGDPSNENLYVGLGHLAYRWNGSTFTSVSGTVPQAQFLSVKPDSNRLVAANFAGGIMGAGKSRVGFSDPGKPEVFTYTAGPPETGNFVDLAPGDGSQITGLATWGEKVFAFKEQRFFVFGNEGTLSDGTAEFFYRPVEGYGATVPVVAGDEGVFFFNGRTVMLTTGSTPAALSGPVDRFFTKQATIAGSTFDPTGRNPILGYSNGRLYVTVPTTGTLSSLTLIYDARHGFWTAMCLYGSTIGAGYVTTLTDSHGTPFTYFYATDHHLARLDPSLTDDNGSAITWAYQTGYSSAGGYFRQRIISSGERKNHFAVDILGASTGVITHQVLSLNGRPNDVADTGGSVTLGTYPATARGHRRRGARGTHFAHRLSGTGPAVVSGLTYLLQSIEADS